MIFHLFLIYLKSYLALKIIKGDFLLLTAHYMIKNEENFIKPSILSVLPFVDEILVFDTGSTDETLNIIKSINSEKIKLFQEQVKTKKELTEIRNKMISMTKTPFFIVVDGDEVYDTESMQFIIKELEGLSKDVYRIELCRLNFVKNFYFVARKQFIGRIYRTDKIVFLGDYPFEEPFVKGNLSVHAKNFSTRFSDKIRCFHFCLLERSSKDKDVKLGRSWRKTPFPVFPYFGKLPEIFGKQRKINIFLLPFDLIFLNIKGFLDRKKAN